MSGRPWARPDGIWMDRSQGMNKKLSNWVPSKGSAFRQKKTQVSDVM